MNEIVFRVHVPDDEQAGLWGTDAKVTIEEESDWVIDKEFIDSAKEALAELYDTPKENVLTEKEHEAQKKANEELAREMEKNAIESQEQSGED